MKKFKVVTELTIENIVEAKTEKEAEEKILNADIPELLNSNYQGWDLLEIRRHFTVTQGEI